MTIFERHEEGPVAIKFKEAAHAEECNGLMNGRFFGGRQLKCDFWDGTNYMVKVRSGCSLDSVETCQLLQDRVSCN